MGDGLGARDRSVERRGSPYREFIGLRTGQARRCNNET